MKLETMGKVRKDVNVKEAVQAEAIIRALKRHGPMLQKDLWSRSTGQRVGRERFNAVVAQLAEQGTIVLQATNYVNSFMVRLNEAKGAGQ